MSDLKPDRIIAAQRKAFIQNMLHVDIPASPCSGSRAESTGEECHHQYPLSITASLTFVIIRKILSIPQQPI